MIPKSITIFTDALVSLDRIEALIVEAEKYDSSLFSSVKKNDQNDDKNDDTEMSKNDDDQDDDNGENGSENQNTKIILKSVTAVRAKNAIILRDISFSLGPTGLILIVGANASGKTSLLLSIINELKFTVGDASIKPSEVCRRVYYFCHDCSSHFIAY